MASEQKRTGVDFASTTGTGGGEGESYKKFDLDKLVEAVEKYQFTLDEEGEKRDAIRLTVRGIEKTVKKINFMLLDIHRDASEKNLLLTGEKGALVLERDIHPLMQDLAQHVPKNEYYKYNEIWRNTFQRLAAVACTIHFLMKGNLASLDECATLMNLPVTLIERKPASTENNLFLDFDEYLLGLLEMGNELSRLCRNCITFGGSTTTVFGIHGCMSELNAGMHYITFKNDYLRKRYDGLKYHLKTVEEVVYDLKIRKLEEESNLEKARAGEGDQAAGDTGKKQKSTSTTMGAITPLESETEFWDGRDGPPPNLLKAKRVPSSTQVLFRRKDSD